MLAPPPASRSSRHCRDRGSRATARVLVGEVNPRGKLPYSVSRQRRQVSVYHHQAAVSGYRRGTMGPATEYLDMPGQPPGEPRILKQSEGRFLPQVQVTPLSSPATPLDP